MFFFFEEWGGTLHFRVTKELVLYGNLQDVEMGCAVDCSLIVEFPGHTHLLFYSSEKNNFIRVKQFMSYFQVKK